MNLFIFTTMITISFVNDSTTDLKKKENFKKSFQKEFSRVDYGEVDVIFDIISPTPSLGIIDTLIFISIEDKNGNYYRSYPNKDYLHNLVIGIKNLNAEDVIDANNYELINNEGSWNYLDDINAESRALNSFCYEICSDVKYFNSALFYYVKADNCKKSFSNKFIFINKSLEMRDLLNYACERCHSEKFKGAWSYKFSESLNIHSFISLFITEAENKTKQGILTRKKIDLIKKDSILINRVINAMGSRLCVVSGNAGSGKTLSLMRIAYKTLSREYDKEGEKRNHNVRFLTYNNMLVFDIRNTLRTMGYFSPNNLSVHTLHKFFYDMFRRTTVVWVKYSDDLTPRIKELLATCETRVKLANELLLESYNVIGKKERTPLKQLEAYKSKDLKDDSGNKYSQLKESLGNADLREVDSYLSFLLKDNRWNTLSLSTDLENAKTLYLQEKKQKAIDIYLNNVFLTDYENILKDMYFLIEDPKKFMEENGLETKRDFLEFVSTVDNLYDIYSDENVDDSIKSINNMINWSHVFIIDEAQDCSIYEKALLYKTLGSENIIVATGGKDQLIRKPKENDWSILFGKPVEKETITLRRTNQRQKANIVRFLNEYAKYYKLDSNEVAYSPETKDKGRVIIDIKKYKEGQLPLNEIASLRNQGIDYGCSDYESLMVLLPHLGFTQASSNPEDYKEEMNIDVTDTVSFSMSVKRGLIDFGEKDFEGTKDMKICDCTINSKNKLNPGQCDTRFLFYDSCRGLESWNVMCINADIFYSEKIKSEDARKYAIEQAGLIQDFSSMYKTRFGAIWCYMAFTRPMDTLYISISDTTSPFSISLLKIAESCGDAVEIIK